MFRMKLSANAGYSSFFVIGWIFLSKEFSNSWNSSRVPGSVLSTEVVWSLLPNVVSNASFRSDSCWRRICSSGVISSSCSCSLSLRSCSSCFNLWNRQWWEKRTRQNYMHHAPLSRQLFPLSFSSWALPGLLWVAILASFPHLRLPNYPEANNLHFKKYKATIY